jgi:hypothetical protein
MAVRMSRLERELGELLSATERDEDAVAPAQPERSPPATAREESTPA